MELIANLSDIKKKKKEEEDKERSSLIWNSWSVCYHHNPFL